MSRLAVLAVLAFASSTRIAHADSNEPWADGVSADKQAQATKLFDEGNTLFAEKQHAPAAEKYRAALALWDHPRIRFNLAVALIGLDRFLEAADELDRALRFGQKPFTPDLYQQAQDYQKLLARSVGTVEASCEQAGVHVSLDGKPWFDCPGKQTQRVLAGPHSVLGEHPGFAASSQRLFVTGGAVAAAQVRLVSLESSVTFKYRHPRWMPWTIAGAGAAIALTGLGFWLDGRSQMDAFRSELATTCPSGCNLDTEPALRGERNGAEVKGDIGIAFAAAGGTAAIVGVVLAISNRPVRVLPNVEVTPATGGAVAHVGWRF